MTGDAFYWGAFFAAGLVALLLAKRLDDRERALRRAEARHAQRQTRGRDAKTGSDEEE